ncbi:MAG: lipid-A-disaccharide synthase [Holosporales bacterium]|jgi:lipid-A-disaccharide synthase|nr:lipid-A-disaccharide synthase [Holosporales bacterium]
MKRLYIIAGEASGDFLGAGIIDKLKGVNIKGIGGKLMESKGFKSLFDINDISVGGLIEVIPHILKIKRLINKTVDDILTNKADAILTIDSPGFCFRVAKKVRKRDPKIKLMHLVAPSVWAWRPGRAKSVAKLYDQLLTLFDFEPQYFVKYGLKTTFVGHPVVEKFAGANGEKEDILLLMPGSRTQEIKTLLPIFLKSLENIEAKRIAIPTLPNLEPLVKAIIGAGNIEIVSDEDEKLKLYKSAKLAIVASGTATLQLALSECPMVVCYKLSWVSYWIVRSLIKVRFISLVNIILGEAVVPELIQKDCSPEKISIAASKLNVDVQLKNFKKLRTKLIAEGKIPSEEIATAISQCLNEN